MASMSNLFDYDMPWPRQLTDQNFGIMLTPEDVMAAVTSPVLAKVRPWWPQGSGSSIKVEKDKWQVNVDVQHFAPDEITVKIADGFILVEGKHEEKKDEHGYISRQFSRRFKLSEGTDPDAVTSRLSSDGVLTVVAPKKVEAAKGERTVPITQTGPIKPADAEQKQ